MNNDKNLNIQHILDLANNINEMRDDKAKISHLRQCLDSAHVRFEELCTYADKLTEEVLSIYQSTAFISTGHEAEQCIQQLAELNAKLESIPPIINKLQEFMMGINNKAMTIGAKYGIVN